VFAVAFERECYGEACEGEGSVLSAGQQLVEHGAKHEEQRLHHFHGFFEGEELFEREDRLDGNHEVRMLATCEKAQTFAFLSEAHD
jgi:hypothetical protein